MINCKRASEVQGVVFDLGGVVTRYRRRGDPSAPAVVLLHGASSGLATWDRLSTTLVAVGWQTVALDLRGHGGASRCPQYPLAAYPDDVVALLDALGLERVASAVLAATMA